VRTATVVALALVAGTAATALIIHRRHVRARMPHPECVLGPTVEGIDVSYYQNVIDWPRVQRAGIQFAFIRIADGAQLRDPQFANNWAGAGQAGIVRGAYVFFRPDQDVDAQADLAIEALRGHDHDVLPPVLDVEVAGGLPSAQVAARARAWVDRVRDQLGVEPIVYTGGELWRAGGSDLLADQPLWLAHYTSGCPTVPNGWLHWTFWQQTDHGAVPGIDGSVDLDVFRGTLAELHALE
jgi:lysozyme